MKEAIHLESEAVDQLEELVQRVESLELQIQQIFERNHRVESNKSWELAPGRIIIIALLTFLSTSAVFFLIGIEAFFLSAIIPTLGYLLSTLSLSYLRSLQRRTEQRNRIEASQRSNLAFEVEIDDDASDD